MLFAARCAVCDRPGASPCPACHAQLRPASPDPDPPGVDGLVALLRYDGPARELITRLKYHNRRLALSWLAAGLAGEITARGIAVDVVTWAPTTAAHRRQRGHDHAALLARAVGRPLGAPVRALLKRHPGPAQTGRSARDRLTEGPRFSPVRRLATDTRVLVVDDVVTTGATMSRAISALRSAGAVAVPAALARTPMIAAPDRTAGTGRSR